MTTSDVNTDKNQIRNRVLRLEAELNYAKAELAQYSQIDGDRQNYGLTCEDYIQLSFEVAFEGLVIHHDFIIVDVNAAISEIWGDDVSGRTELIGKNILDFVTPEFFDLVKTRISSDYSKSYEVIGIRRDGSQFPVEVQGKSIQWRGQNVKVTAIRDISDRKAIESELLDTQKRYQTLFNHKSDAVFIHSFTESGKPSQFIEVNDAACKSLGYSRAELLLLSPSDIIPKEFSYRKEVMKILLEQKYATQEILYLAKDGKIFPIELSLSKLETSEGKPLVIGFARDISDRKNAEAALIEIERRYQALVTAKCEAVFIHSFSDNGLPENFIEVNEAACESLGYTKAELLRMSPRDITPKGYKPPFNIPQKLARDRHALFEAQHITKDGRMFPIEVRTVLLETAEKNLVIDFARDISDRKATEMKLERIASLDYLTQIANRRQFDRYLEAEWLKAWRDRTNLSLIMCDIDCFKLYNDCYGHQTGDKCLQQVAVAIANSIKRPTDLVARYGGEEFGVILPITNLDGAINVANTIKQSIKALKITHERSTIDPFITISLGIACLIPASADYSVLINTADRALYCAKQSGRNCFHIIQEES